MNLGFWTKRWRLGFFLVFVSFFLFSFSLIPLHLRCQVLYFISLDMYICIYCLYLCDSWCAFTFYCIIIVCVSFGTNWTYENFELQVCENFELIHSLYRCLRVRFQPFRSIIMIPFETWTIEYFYFLN